MKIYIIYQADNDLTKWRCKLHYTIGDDGLIFGKMKIGDVRFSEVATFRIFEEAREYVRLKYKARLKIINV